MNAIVLYQSKTGFTERYATWLAEALGCPCKPLKRAMKDGLKQYKTVIFGGWVMGGMIMGLNKLQQSGIKPAAVFAVGSTPPYEEVQQTVREQNKLGETPFYYFEGGFSFEKLGFFKRMLLKALKKSISKKETKNRQEEFMAQALGTSFDHSDKAQIKPLATAVLEKI